MLYTYPANRVCSMLIGRQRPAGHLYRIYKQWVLPDVQTKTSARFPLSTNLSSKAKLGGIVLISRGRYMVWTWHCSSVARSAPRRRAGSRAGVAGTRTERQTGISSKSPLQVSDPFCLPLDGAALAGRWRFSSLGEESPKYPSAQAPSKTLPFLIQIPFLIGWRESEHTAAPVPHAALATVTSAFSCGKDILNLFILMISGGLVAGTPH